MNEILTEGKEVQKEIWQILQFPWNFHMNISEVFTFTFISNTIQALIRECAECLNFNVNSNSG
jgi:hypothetical protein